MTSEHYSQPHSSQRDDACNARDNQPMGFPTSPWTEAYHAMTFESAVFEADSCQDQPAAYPSATDANRPMHAADTELQPTRDALSDIYNRGYSD